MSKSLKSAFSRFNSKSPDPSRSTEHPTQFSKASIGKLFPKTDPSVDGKECLHDCETCTVKLPSRWKIKEGDKLYGEVKRWETHLIVATGKTDWVKHVEDEKGSIMEAVKENEGLVTNGKLMLSASNMPVPEQQDGVQSEGAADPRTTVLLLPAFIMIDNVTRSRVPSLLATHVSNAPTTTTPLVRSPSPSPELNSHSEFIVRSCPHKHIILLCSQKTRDARCGQSAPLLRKEFERHLRPLGLQRDLNDTRPGGVGIYFVSHVGGHKYSANVMIYRRADTAGQADHASEAAQCIWIARVRPEDCENIIRYTVLRGKVVKPERQLRGGFDRVKGLVSW